MKFANAQLLKIGDVVYYINGKHKETTSHVIVDIEKEDKNIFIRCEDGKLYHHSAFKSKN